MSQRAGAVRLASPATATAVGVVILVLAAALVPLLLLARQDVPSNVTPVAPFLPLAAVGWVRLARGPARHGAPDARARARVGLDLRCHAEGRGGPGRRGRPGRGSRGRPGRGSRGRHRQNAPMTKKEAASQVCAAKARLGVTWAQLAASEARN
jgi:hypothetical protein